MIVQEVVDRVRSTFGDAAAVQVQDEDIIRWINDAQIEIVKYNENALQTTGFVDLISDTAQYTLPVDLMLLRSLRYKYANMDSYKALRYQSMQQFDESIDSWDGSAHGSGHPVFYTKYDNNVILFPTPDTSTASGLKILYNRRPTDVVDTLSSLALPIIYHNTIVKYCLLQASLLDEDLEPAVMYRNDFQSDMELLPNRENVDPVEFYPVITVRECDM